MGEKKEYLQYIADNLCEGVCCYNTDMTIEYANAEALKATGFVEGGFTGEKCSEIMFHTDENGGAFCKTGRCPLKNAFAVGGVFEADMFIRHRNGSLNAVVSRVFPFFDGQGAVAGALEIFGSSSSKLLAFRHIEKLKKLAFIDSLTETGNRAYSEIKIQTKIIELKKNLPGFGLLFADIDRFKLINDSYGHEIGDKALKFAARTMLASVRGRDFVGRWGGEEFIVLLQDVREPELRYVAEKIRHRLEKSPLVVAGKKIDMTVSIGATLATENDTIETLISRADRLMYSCKARGRNSVSVMV